MKAPSHTDRFVRVTAYLSDVDFGYDNWHARQFPAGMRDLDTELRPAVLIVCKDQAEQDEALAFLEARAAATGG